MILKSTWNIASDDENSRGSFLSDCDSEFNLSPPLQYSSEKRSNSALNKLSIDRNESPMTRSRAKADGKPTPSVLKEPHRSTIRQSIDSITEMTSAFTNSILSPKKELSNNYLPTSPTDGVNKLSDWFESCTLDENKFSKNYLWSSCETNSQYKRRIISSSPNSTFNSNSFSISQTSPLFIPSSSNTSLFDQPQAQLWSHFRFATSTIRNNLWTKQLYSTPSNLFNSPVLSSSPPQIVPSPFARTPSSSTPLLKQQCPVTNSEVSINKEDLIIPQSSSSKIFFMLIIFIVGLMLGYFLTNTFPPNLIRHWFFILEQTSIEISQKYFHLFSNYLQIVMQYFSSNIFN